MTPSEIRRQTLSQLRKTYLKMMSPRWDLELEGQPTSEVTEAAKLLGITRQRLHRRMQTLGIEDPEPPR